MIRDLVELRIQMAQAVEEGNEALVIRLVRKYLRLYKQCWPS